MMKGKLKETIEAIEPLNQEMMEQVREHQANLTKPEGSLGELETISIKGAGITGEMTPDFSKRAVVVMAGDHGVAKEGVSAFPQVVTQQMVANFCNGGAAINVLARQAKAEVKVVDVGIANPVDAPGVVCKNVKRGTDSFCQGQAMSREEAIRALEVGIEVAEELIDEGYTLLATGEMGIGNTTPSSAIISVITGQSVEKVVGPGSGINDEGIKRKIGAIKKGIELNQPDQEDALDILSKVGGLEIAGLAGLILGAAANRVPVVVDGFISTAAALIAQGLAPLSVEYMIGSHCSAEPAHRLALRHLRLKPLLDLNMRLGEGTGAVLVFNLIDSAIRVVKEMATFEDAQVDKG